MLRAVAANPALMQSLASDRVRVAVVASADQSAAVGMMLRMDSGLDAEAIMEDVRLVTDGRVSPVLIWEKAPASCRGGPYAHPHFPLDAAPAFLPQAPHGHGLEPSIVGVFPPLRSKPPRPACHRDFPLL